MLTGHYKMVPLWIRYTLPSLKIQQVNFPAAFGKDENALLVGSAVKETIQHNEAFLYIPNKLLITTDRARASEIGFILESHDNIFKAH